MNCKKIMLMFAFLMVFLVSSVSATDYPYWVEHDENNNPINNVWIKLNLSASSTKTIFAYKKVGYSPNGDSVFEFFDDFEGSSLDTSKWNHEAGSLPTISSSELFWSASDGTDDLIVSIPSFDSYSSTGLVYDTFVKVNSPYGEQYVNDLIEYSGGYGDTWTTIKAQNSNFDSFIRNQGTNIGNNPTTIATADDNWHLFTTKISPSEVKFFMDGVSKRTESVTFDFTNLRARIRQGTSYGALYYEWVKLRKYTTNEPSVTVTDMGTYYKIDITNNEATDLTNYQIAIPISSLDITSTTESIKFTDTSFEVGLTQNISYTEFKVGYDITHECYWNNASENVTEVNLTLVAINNNDSTTLYNQTFTNVSENQTVSYTYTLQVSDAHDLISFRCIYTDDLGDTETIETNKTVENSIPTAPTTIDINPDNVAENQNISVNILGSTDTDNDTLTYYYSIYDYNTSAYIYENKSENETFTLTQEQLAHDFKIEFWAYDGYNYSANNSIDWHDTNHFTYTLDDYSNISGTKYADTIEIIINYRCNDTIQFTGFDATENNTFFTINGTCNDTWQSYVYNYQSNTEGNRTIRLAMNDSYNYNYTFDYIADLVAPNVTLILNNTYGFRNNITESFSVQVYDNISNLTCNITANNDEYLNQNFTNNETQNFSFNFTDGTNNWIATCYDFVNHSTTDEETIVIYTKNITLINEETGNNFSSWSDMYGLRIISENYTYDFLDTNQSQIWYVTTENGIFRLEKRYNSDPNTVLFVDLKPSLVETDVPVCVAPPQTFYEIIIYSSISKPVAVMNNYAQCYALADYTQYAYQDALNEKIYSIKSIYYLYTYEDGQKVFLASIDGGSAYEIALDVLESQQQQYTFSLATDVVTVQKTTNTTLKIYYNNVKEDNTKVIIDITDDNNQNVFSHTETSDPNEFTIYFDYSTLNISDLITLTITKYKESGSIETTTRLFNKAGGVGFINPNVAILFAVISIIFALTIVAIQYAFGWFGVLAGLVALGFTTLAPSNAKLVFIQAILTIVIIFIGIVWFNEHSSTT